MESLRLAMEHQAENDYCWALRLRESGLPEAIPRDRRPGRRLFDGRYVALCWV